MIRGSEDAVLSAIAAVKAALAEDKRAGGEDGADGDRPSRKHGDSKSDAPIKQTDTKPVPTFPVVPVGASEETQEALLAATGNKMNKNARRRAARKKAGASAREDGPEWVDGLAGVTDQPDAILAKLLASSAAPAPLSTPVRSLPRPPPGLAPAASPPQEDASGILAQLRSLSVTAPAPAAAEVAPAVSGRYYTSSSGFSVRLG